MSGGEEMSASRPIAQDLRHAASVFGNVPLFEARYPSGFWCQGKPSGNRLVSEKNKPTNQASAWVLASKTRLLCNQDVNKSLSTQAADQRLNLGHGHILCPAY